MIEVYYFILKLSDQTSAASVEDCQQLNSASRKDCSINLLSGLSESGKNSSESVEILSGGTECTTSPDSDAFSISTPSSIHGM